MVSVTFPTKPKCLVTFYFFSANNLYGLAQSSPMPVSDFRWLDREEIDGLDVLQMTDEQETGFILEVDLTYPKGLHEEHNSFPLAPEHLKIKDDMLSEYAKGKKSRKKSILVFIFYFNYFFRVS